MAYPQTSYVRRDALLSVTQNFPAQNTSGNSTSIDLGLVNPALIGTDSDVVVNFPATTTATGQTITVKLQDSADNSSFADISACGSRLVTGASNATAATEFRWRLNNLVRRYVRMVITMSATTGDQTALSATLQVQT